MKVNMTVEGSAVARIGRRESPFAMVIENPVALGGTPPPLQLLLKTLVFNNLCKGVEKGSVLPGSHISNNFW